MIRCAATALIVPTLSSQVMAKKNDETFVNSLGMKMVRIQAGHFQMGSEQPLLFVSFTHDFFRYRRGPEETPPYFVTDAVGKKRRIHGMFAALSFDEGETWPVKTPVTPGGPPRQLTGVTLTGSLLLDDTRAEPRGYLSGCQTPDGVIHVISSGLHYSFNMAWLETPIPASTPKED
jgi:hypothetical protein